MYKKNRVLFWIWVLYLSILLIWFYHYCSNTIHHAASTRTAVHAATSAATTDLSGEQSLNSYFIGPLPYLHVKPFRQSSNSDVLHTKPAETSLPSQPPARVSTTVGDHHQAHLCVHELTTSAVSSADHANACPSRHGRLLCVFLAEHLANARISR